MQKKFVSTSFVYGCSFQPLEERLIIVGENYAKSIYRSYLVFSNFVWFFCLFQNILSWLVRILNLWIQRADGSIEFVKNVYSISLVYVIKVCSNSKASYKMTGFSSPICTSPDFMKNVKVSQCKPIAFTVF